LAVLGSEHRSRGVREAVPAGAQGDLRAAGSADDGHGPRVSVSLDPTSGAELKANPNWWGGKVDIQHISIKFFASENSEALAFRAGELDVAFPGSPKAFASTAGRTLITVPSCSKSGSA
jgi:hypothetical protein